MKFWNGIRKMEKKLKKGSSEEVFNFFDIFNNSLDMM